MTTPIRNNPMDELDEQDRMNLVDALIFAMDIENRDKFSARFSYNSEDMAKLEALQERLNA